MTSAVEMIIPARPKDLGGFEVRRVLPFAKRRKVGPWVFFDHMGPVEFAPGPGVNVRPHPHINLATVTYLFEGQIWHRDSLGSDCVIEPGDVNLMAAGAGIVHSERETEARQAQMRRLDGLQLWLALPEADEEMAAAFHHYASADIPRVDRDGVSLRVMMGTAYGAVSPVRTFAETLYVEGRAAQGARVAAPDAAERAVYVCSGALEIDGQRVEAYQMAVLAPGAVEMTALSDAHFVVIGGEPLSERHIYWNFVSSRPERIEQAKADWKAGRFPRVPGDEIEFIPLPE